MSERLVVEKGPRQRRIEDILFLVLPPLIGAACWVGFGPGLWQVPAILFAFIALSLVGNAIAIRLGGELMSPAERWRRRYARIAEQPLWSMLLWMFLLYLFIFLGTSLPMIDPRAPPRAIEFVFVIIVAGSVGGSGVCVFYMRRQVQVALAYAKDPPPLQSPWRAIGIAIPFRIVALLVLAGAYWVAGRFSTPTNLLVLLLGTSVALFVETALRSRLIKSGPLLWNNFSFPAALVASASLNGVFFAAFTGLMKLLDTTATETGERIREVSTYAAAGLLIGMLCSLIPWALTRITTVKAKG